MYGVGIAAPAIQQVVELEHGAFTDGVYEFVVRSTTSDPGVVRVHAVNAVPGARWVAVLTDVGTDNVDATWCGVWECKSPTWKRQCAALTFRTYLTEQPTIRQHPSLAGAR